MPIKGGKAIASGSYGCVFRPALKCTGQKDEDRHDGVSKLMYNEDANEEMDEMKPIFKTVKTLPNAEKYFAISNTHMCQPGTLDEDDKNNFENKCSNFVRDGINVGNVNNRLDDLSIINMPDLGRDLHEYINEQESFSFESFQKFNAMMINLLLNGVVPMNQSNVLHHDLKDTNIMVDKNDNTIIIDWGFSGVSTRENPVPINVIGRPVQYNTPFSAMLINKTFTKEYKKVCERMNKKPLSNNQNASFIEQYYSYHIKRNPGHENYLKQTISFLFPEEKMMDLFKKYNAEILDNFTDGCNFDMVKYFKDVYIFNVDIWGACTVFMTFIKYKNILKNLPQDLQKRTITIYKEILLDICFKNGSQRIDVNKIIDLLSELSGNISPVPPNKKNSLVFPELPLTSPRGKDSLKHSTRTSLKVSKTKKQRKKRCPSGYRRHPKTKKCTVMSGPDKGKEIDTP